MSAPALILDSNLKAILDAGFEACFGGALSTRPAGRVSWESPK